MIFHVWVGYEERKTPIDFEVNRSKVKVVETGNRNILSAQYLENLLLDCYDISYVGWYSEEEDPY
jgi:hypothetical protein